MPASLPRPAATDPGAFTPRPAAYAARPEESRGRPVAEAESPTRSCFQRDRDRILHSGAFRKLMNKTQVFVYDEGDYYRTRLTHSLEVAQIARSIARALQSNEDLAEALALAHDLGHPPFGHPGEEALDAEMRPFGGFDHNEQTFRVLTLLEKRYAGFDGLNLTWETLEGVVKHNGPLTGANTCPDKALRPTIAQFDRGFSLELHSQPGVEAQVAALSDDIAYNTHDIDDGLRAGLFSIEDIAAVPLVGDAFAEVEAAHGRLDPPRRINEAVRRLIDRLVNDLLAESRRRLAEAMPADAQAVRDLAEPVVAFSRPMGENARALKSFLFERMYRHGKVNRMAKRARRVVRDLFRVYQAEPDRLPPDWRAPAARVRGAERARIVADYVAGMTDRFAIAEHRRLQLPSGQERNL
ncbi:MAG: deoxyguanosinetriphosphate triphosphohydrolase [Kiloniellales bacterium]